MNVATLNLCLAVIATTVSSIGGMPMLAELYMSLYTLFGASAEWIEIMKFGNEFIIFCPTRVAQEILLSFGVLSGPNFTLSLMSCVTAYALEDLLDSDTDMVDGNDEFDPG